MCRQENDPNANLTEANVNSKTQLYCKRGGETKNKTKLGNSNKNKLREDTGRITHSYEGGRVTELRETLT